MFQHLGPGNAALFVDVADDEHREALFLAKAHDPHGALSHLGDAARCGVHVGIADGLDGVYDDHLRLEIVYSSNNAVKVGLCKHIDLPVCHAEAVGTEL